MLRTAIAEKISRISSISSLMNFFGAKTAQDDLTALNATFYKSLRSEIYYSNVKKTLLKQSEGFGDPGWDILMNLFHAHFEHKNLSQYDIQSLVNLSEALARRWLANLESQGYVSIRKKSANDGLVDICITDKAIKLLTDYLQSKYKSLQFSR